MIIQSRPRGLSAAIAVLGALGGAFAALHYHRLGLTLSHYDSRGHLVVARRIVDSITPGWQQIGAVWLPLPHLLNLVPVQADVLYRSGASAVAISIVSFAVATASIAWIAMTLTGSAAAAVAAAGVFALNPNVLYLQATPMTEPLQIALTMAAIALLLEWLNAIGASKPRVRAALVGWTFAAAVLTRYETWPITVCALVAAVLARWRRGDSWPEACRRVAPIAVYPAASVVAFMIFSRIVIGQWFVSSGFFVPDNKAIGRPLVAAAEIWWGTHVLSGYPTIAAATAGLIALLSVGLLRPARADGLIALSLIGAAALPWAAFVNGHPFRIRYMVPLIAMEAVGVGAAVGAFRWLRVVDPRRASRSKDLRYTLLETALAVGLLAVAVFELRPLDATSPMVVEAQWDRPNRPVRQRVTDCLRADYDGETIMASMGSLGHYMQEAARDGFEIRDFLHEGNGDIWLAALDGPRPFVGWVMIEEKANGGDMLANTARANPRFLDGFSRMCEGAGLALYRRTPRAATEVPVGNGDHGSSK